ncbi:hypothetical protein [Kocuria rosea]|uniref:hypothetical protein n=1 Tax=Kocuria rosea TaxID=1275 RepID=UPI002B255A56|nr:hypothetical protein [Kocuria rosea]MEB2526669.1 hypothetical protein [Kocuria rosea]MEB2620219.1 hypothetical protein [Kocuria rosea]
MVDYTAKALEANRAKKTAERAQFEAEKAAEKAQLDDHLRRVAPKLNAALAKVFDAQPTDPEFKDLIWDWSEPVRMEMDRQDGHSYITVIREHGRIGYKTEFQGVPITASGREGHYWFSAHTSTGSSQGFSSLTSFGDAVAHMRGEK